MSKVKINIGKGMSENICKAAQAASLSPQQWLDKAIVFVIKNMKEDKNA